MARILTQRKTAKKRNVTRHAINAERQKLHVVKGDTVRVLRGDDKGKEGKILRVLPKTGRVVVEGVNFVKKHRKARNAGEEGGIVSMEAPGAIRRPTWVPGGGAESPPGSDGTRATMGLPSARRRRTWLSVPR